MLDAENRTLLKDNVNTFYNCVQSSLVQICLKYKIEPEIMFSVCFGVIYYENYPISIGDRMQPRFGLELCEFMEQVLNLDVKELVNDNKIEFKELYEQKEKGTDIMLTMDAYYCPWNVAYQKAHIAHMCNLEAVDVINNKLLCRDLYVGNDLYEWSKELFDKGCRKVVFAYGKKTDARFRYEDCFSHLVNDITEESIEHTYDIIMKDFAGVQDIHEIFENFEPEVAKLIINTRQLSFNHKGIAYLLLRMESSDVLCHQKDSEIQLLAEEMFELGELWQKISLIGIKMVVRKICRKGNLEDIISCLNEIKLLEMNAYKELKKFIDIKTCSLIGTVNPTQ